MIDDELLVKTRTNTCLSYTSAIPSFSVPVRWNYNQATAFCRQLWAAHGAFHKLNA